MELKSSNATLTTAAADILQVAADKKQIIKSIFLVCGSVNSSVTIVKNNGSSDVLSSTYALNANETLIIDSPICLPAGYKLRASATATAQIDINSVEL